MSRQCTHYGRWPQHGFTSLKKLRPQSVTSRIQPGSDVIEPPRESWRLNSLRKR
ncbi:putative transposase [Shigella boydii 3594-74]|nr:putative transposase [Shigella boydii 3594-74]